MMMGTGIYFLKKERTTFCTKHAASTKSENEDGRPKER